MATLSKSKLIAYRQCPRRLWLEVHHPELRNDSTATQASFSIGYSVGDIARQIYDPEQKGLLIDAQASGYPQAFAQTQEALKSDAPIFEAGFKSHGALAFADILMPVCNEDSPAWRMVEVKSTSTVKDYHVEDLAIQFFIARQNGASMISASLAHVDSSWTYPGNDDYRGLLVEEDLTDTVSHMTQEVITWIADAHAIVDHKVEPVRHTGAHCNTPYQCGYFAHCRSAEPTAEFPIDWLPRIQSQALKSHISQEQVIDMRQVPDNLLNAKQLRVKQYTLENRTYFDIASSSRELAQHSLPAFFLDFETIKFVVPIWAGTRPYQQIPFQFSLHILATDRSLSHQEFLDLSGNDPSENFCLALIKACAQAGPIFVYNKGFEGGRIRELAERFSQYKNDLLALIPRLVDLLPIAEQNFYHPSQQGSWSIKKVLPAMAPELRYDALEGVQDGTAAMSAYLEAIAPQTSAERKSEIQKQLLTYCRLDTFAMIRVWSVLADHADLRHLQDAS